MANTSSAKKAVRSSERKHKINDQVRRKYKAARKDVRKAVDAGDKKAAEAAMPNAMKFIDKAVKKNILHKNTGSRYKSRLAKAVSTL